MITATVRLKHPSPGWKFIDTGPINAWLINHVGANTRYRDLVDEHRPWHDEHTLDYIEYSFAREQDATLFALRWA